MKLHHVALTIKDLEISIPFYESNFGFKEVNRFRRDDLGATGVMLAGENVMIELWQFDNFQEGERVDLSVSGIKHIAFTVDDVQELHTKFTDNGIIYGEVKTGPHGGTYFFIKDPDGNDIEIYKPNKIL
ncbi:VOC family protein [Candidatus Nomurabacteria bacterium]|nr:VOC family protein [Candidatus Nomurabacteria bacterium]